MKTEVEINAQILQVTVLIMQKYPELLKYLDEEPVELAAAPAGSINPHSLLSYYSSLDALLKHYAAYHR